MMNRLRSPLRALGVTAFLICALSFAGLGLSHARPPNASPSVPIHGLPCNAACKAYLTWSHRVTAMFRPSRPLKMFRPTRPLEKNAAHHGRPPRMMVHHAPKMRQRGLNSFAQLRVQSDATPDSAEMPRTAETPRAELAPSRPRDQIADRFPAAAEFMTAKRAGTDGATPDAAESTDVAVADITPATQGTGRVDASAHGADMRLVASLLLALCTLAGVRILAVVRGRRDADRERARLLTSDRAIA